MDFKGTGYLTMDCIHVAHKIVQLRTLANSVMKLQGLLRWKTVRKRATSSLPRRTSYHEDCWS